MTSAYAPVPEVCDGRACEDGSDHCANTVDCNQKQQGPARASDSLTNKKTLKLTQDRAFDESQAEVVNDHAGPKWLFKISAGGSNLEEYIKKRNAHLHYVDLFHRT